MPGNPWKSIVVCVVGVLSLAGGRTARGQCQYEVTAVIDGPNVCGIFGEPFVRGFGLNDQGHVVGDYQCANGNERAFVWYGDGTAIPLDMPAGTAISSANDINEAGQIVGGYVVPGDAFGSLAFVTDPATREFVTIGVLPGATISTALSLNEAAQVVGWSVNGGTGQPPREAFLWQDGELLNLSPLLDVAQSEAHDVNDQGQVVGYRRVQPADERIAFLWERGGFIDLGPVPAGYTSEATAVNNRGEVVGYGRITVAAPPGFVRHAFLWSGGRMMDLGVPPGQSESFARDINDVGQVVGSAGGRAILWQGGAIWDLNELVVDDVGLPFYNATAINNAGKIVARFSASTALLSPLDRPPTDLNIDCRTDGADLALLLEDWGPGISPADFNGDGRVGFFDLSFLLMNWD